MTIQATDSPSIRQTSLWTVYQKHSVCLPRCISTLTSPVAHSLLYYNYTLHNKLYSLAVCGSEYVKHATHNTNQIDTFHPLRLTTQRTLKAALSN
ncbi:hypothetical protein CEXT_41791 [Caerostris extrusa]|uniref:Uncharacterized protein n=1 Tax=Caerostris extrusa TaxID=172846 RepID=A0AAV4XHY6_CAEEX|nr:hypothetical protein CEXT_41791 [Caerostris extrusa]